MVAADHSNSITQAEYNKLFDEYLKEQKFDGKDWDRWFSNHVFKFYKKTQDEGIEVRAGFYVDSNGERIDE
jgi:hypothetical protein